MGAVLQHGLRITPFSGGSLGKGIYLTPEHAKASWNVLYITTCLLRVGVHWGKYEDERTNTLCSHETGTDEMRKFDGKRVVVPIGPPVPQKEFESSGFLQSQYVVYDEGQTQLRYLTKFSFA
ncbi:protein mono-ADP-ribosyltransferase PARP3-like [Penaeus japonicus]|uniref:protein mono-ADP-ribosyltransferase PARP3-like n=1 Tax=Penaeus japonicus TaxID=27405 RepID=UPI001C70D35F|nr:protein mono-ADP-ribosyltransferase PARP3-like [Penaeus japonicus]